MAFELEGGEQVMFPSPYVPTEQHPLVVTNRRVAHFAPGGSFPVAVLPVEKIDFVGRASERSHVGVSIVLAVLGLILFIVGTGKVLPPVLHAGAPREEKKDEIEGRNADDEYPFEEKKSAKDRAEDLKKLKAAFNPGVPPITADLLLGALLMVVGAGCLYGGYRLFKRKRHVIYCRVGNAVHPIEARDEIQQTMIMGMLQAVRQAAAMAAPPPPAPAPGAPPQ